MSIPMQVSIPLALHLRCPVTFDLFSNKHYKPGEMYKEGHTVNEFAFIDQSSGRFESTLQFAAIIRVLFEHPDWAQLHAFFSKRYGKTSSFLRGDRSMRKLNAPEDVSAYARKKTVTVNFNADLASVGLPGDFVRKLGAAGRTASAAMLGPDPQPCSIGPAISVAMGAAAYMDLIYAGNPPGAYPSQQGGFRSRNTATNLPSTSSSPSGAGGRGRTSREWHELWAAIAEWVYEWESACLENGFISSYSYKYRLSDAERRELVIGQRKPRKYFSTDPIDAADAVRDVFGQLCNDPLRFQGLEWDFLELEAIGSVQQAFYRRFGHQNKDRTKNLEVLARDLPGFEWSQHSYQNVSPVSLKPCPESYRGIDWEGWLLSIQGGDVVVVKTVFQALWAVMLLTQLPLTIEIMEREQSFPRVRDETSVYI